MRRKAGFRVQNRFLRMPEAKGIATGIAEYYFPQMFRPLFSHRARVVKTHQFLVPSQVLTT
ncbi:MAG: hypothetical protein WCO94_14050 [Verrucomicrobiota bacterium]